MRIIFGLGNPGMKYRKTRHNAGFMAADLLAGELRARFRGSSGLAAKIAVSRVGGEELLIVKPQTYMNNSGYAVSAVMEHYGVCTGDITVIYDDADIPLGSLRIRKKGSAGTHNGMRNIIEYLETENFSRIRVGIGKNPPYKTLAEHVLGKFSKQEKEALTRALIRAKDACIAIASDGMEAAQTKYNG